MQITAIKAQIKNPNRVSIFVDTKYSFSLTFDELLTAKLKNGQELSSVELKKLKSISADGKLKARTLEWLMMRPRSARELKDYLRRKEASDELIERLVADFQKLKYQDDRQFAIWWVEQRRTGKQRSARYIMSELGAKGVDREIINEILAENNTKDIDALRILVAKKRKSTRFAADEQKLIAYLARQGYSFSLIKEVLAE